MNILEAEDKYPVLKECTVLELVMLRKQSLDIGDKDFAEACLLELNKIGKESGV